MNEKLGYAVQQTTRGNVEAAASEDFNEESLYLDCSRCSRVDYRPSLCATVHRQVHEARLRKHATIADQTDTNTSPDSYHDGHLSGSSFMRHSWRQSDNGV